MTLQHACITASDYCGYQDTVISMEMKLQMNSQNKPHWWIMLDQNLLWDYLWQISNMEFLSGLCKNRTDDGATLRAVVKPSNLCKQSTYDSHSMLYDCPGRTFRGWSAPSEHRTTYRLVPGTGPHYLEETHKDSYALPRDMLLMMMKRMQFRNKYTHRFNGHFPRWTWVSLFRNKWRRKFKGTTSPLRFIWINDCQNGIGLTRLEVWLKSFAIFY